MKNIIKIITIFAITLFTVSCEKDLPTDTTLESYVGFEMNKQLDLKRNQTSVVPIKVVASESANVDRTFRLQVNMATTETNLAANFYTVPQTVTIPAGSKEGTFNVTVIVNSTNISAGRTIKIEFPQTSGLNQASSYSTVVTNGVTTYRTSQRGIKLFLYEECLNTRVKMNLKFDGYPEETAWRIINSSNVIVSSGGLAANGTTISGYLALGFAAGSTFSSFICLAPGAYTLEVLDSYGDGMFTSATNIGNYRLETLSGDAIATGSGNFGSLASHNFTIN